MKKTTIALFALASAIALASGCSDSETRQPPTSTACGEGTQEMNGVCVPTGDSLDCGAGTFENNGECVPFDPNDATAPTTTLSPTGGRFRIAPATVMLTADEPAMIHVTIDGSDPANATPVPSPATVVQIADGTEIRYFAVDPAGNAEEEQTTTYTLDAVGTSPVTALAAAVTAPDDVTLTWTNPTDADFGGVVVARVTDSIDGRPVDGQTYAVGDNISPHLEVVYVGNAETFSDVEPIGVSEFAVWAHDDLANYSRRQSKAAHIPLPSETATVSIDMDASTVTATTDFAYLNLTGQLTSNNGTSATVELSVENTTTRTIQAPKLVHTNASEGTLAGADGTLNNGNPYWRLWRQQQDAPIATAIAAGETRLMRFQLNGVTATSVVTFNVELVENPIYVAAGWNNNEGLQLVDARDTSNDELALLSVPGNGLSGQNMRAVCSHISNNGRYVYIYHRNSPVIAKLDTTTGQSAQTVTPEYTQAQAHVSMMHFNPADEYLYAVFVDGNHSYRYGQEDDQVNRSRGTDVQHYLLKIDPDTLEEVGRVALAVPEARYWGVWVIGFAISPDGEQAAVGAWSMEVDNVGDGDNLPSASRPYTSWVNMVALGSMTELDRDMNTAGVQPMAVSPLHKPRALAYHPAGTHLYIGTKAWGDNDSSGDLNDIILPILAKVDLATDAVTVLQNGDDDDNSISGYSAMTVHPNGSIWMAGDNGNGSNTPYGVRILDTTDDSISIATGTITRDGTFSVTFSADGTRAFVPTYNSDVHIFNVTNMTEQANLSLDTDSYGHQACVTPF